MHHHQTTVGGGTLGDLIGRLQFSEVHPGQVPHLGGCFRLAPAPGTIWRGKIGIRSAGSLGDQGQEHKEQEFHG
jgi:hypothetical protein